MRALSAFHMTKSQQLEWLRSAQLTAGELFALSLSLFNGWSFADIARSMGVSKQAVGKKVGNARKKLAAVGIETPPPNPSQIRRASPMDPSSLDVSTEIIAVA